MSDRHPKWQRVEPGTVIPAGQPYRVEWEEPVRDGSTLADLTAREKVKPYDQTVPVTQADVTPREWFVDSSWRPPLVLPTEPTWGIAVTKEDGEITGEWGPHPIDACNMICDHGEYERENFLDFIPLTEEQVQRIEAAR